MLWTQPALQEQSGAEITEWFGLDRTIKISWFQPSCHGQGHLEQDCSPLTGSQWRGCRRESLKASTLDLLCLGCQVSQNCHGKTSGVPCWAAPEVSAPCARYRQPCALKGKRKYSIHLTFCWAGREPSVLLQVQSSSQQFLP